MLAIRGKGSPVVLVHGQPGEGSDWKSLVEVLEDRHAVIAPDRPGWGANSEPATGFAGNADWLEDALSSALGATPVVAVGHSFGGGVALSLAIRHPARVKALVLVASVGHAGALSRLDRVLATPPWGDAIVRVGTVAARGLVSGSRRLLMRLERTSISVRRADSLAMMRVLAGEEPVPKIAMRSFSTEQRALVTETADIEARLGSLQVPTVVVTGSRDLVVGLPASRALAEAIPGAELSIVAHAGHLLPLEAPEHLARLIDRYDRLGGLTA
jgi:2-hydroxymuconate-semialdehyde hydrolase